MATCRALLLPAACGMKAAGLKSGVYTSASLRRCSVQASKKRKLGELESMSGSLGRSFVPSAPCVDSSSVHSIKHEPVYSSDTPFGRYYTSHVLLQFA